MLMLASRTFIGTKGRQSSLGTHQLAYLETTSLQHTLFINVYLQFL